MFAIENSTRSPSASRLLAVVRWFEKPSSPAVSSKPIWLRAARTGALLAGSGWVVPFEPRPLDPPSVSFEFSCASSSLLSSSSLSTASDTSSSTSSTVSTGSFVSASSGFSSSRTSSINVSPASSTC